MKKYFTILLVLISITALTLGSCATIVAGGKSMVEISSDMEDVNLVITETNTGMEVYSGPAPASVELKKSAGFAKKAMYEIKATAGDYEPVMVTLATDKVNLAILGNIINTTGMVGIVVDLATGAAYKWSAPMAKPAGAVSGEVMKKEGMLKIMFGDSMMEDKEMMDDDKLMINLRLSSFLCHRPSFPYLPSCCHRT